LLVSTDDDLVQPGEDFIFMNSRATYVIKKIFKIYSDTKDFVE